MARNLIEINGLADFVNYNAIRKSLEQENIARYCENLSIYILNTFPLVSIDSPVDALIVLNIKKEIGNQICFRYSNHKRYLRNVIVPVKVIEDLKDESLVLDNGQVSTADSDYTFSFELNSMKYGTAHFLGENCGFDTTVLYPYPLIFIKSNTTNSVNGNIIIGKELDWNNFFEFLKQQNEGYMVVQSYKPWDDKLAYELTFPNDIKQLIDVASNIDKKNGFLTKNKIDSLGNSIIKDLVVYEHLGERLLIISGKAGTGKTNKLLSLLLYRLKKGYNVKYLTFNNVLVFEVARVIRAYLKSNDITSSRGSSVMTLHKFMYRLSKQLGLLLLMSEKRANQLIATLKERNGKLKEYFKLLEIESDAFYSISYTSINEFIEKVGNNNDNIILREAAIIFLQFLKKQDNSNIGFDEQLSRYINHKSDLIKSQAGKEAFIEDYNEVLKNIIFLLNEREKFYSVFEIQNKLSLLSGLYNIKDFDDKVFSYKRFDEKVNRKLGGFRHGFTVFIDEAQDCFPLERDVIFEIYGHNNVVVVDGGKEQLIRRIEQCVWSSFKGKSISHYRPKLGSTSYRMKSNVLDLCKYIAKNFGMSFELETVESQDKGNIILDFRKVPKYEEIFEQLTLRGNAAQCTPYESLMILVDNSSLSYFTSNGDGIRGSIHEQIEVTEFDNIKESDFRENHPWVGKEDVEKFSPVWDSTNRKKSKNDVPYSNEIRLIRYESCRGLEAWCTANIDVDTFFDRKFSDSDSELHLENTILTLNERKEMYAANWLLMSLTRAMDTLYLKIKDKESRVGKILYQYAMQNKSKFQIYMDENELLI